MSGADRVLEAKGIFAGYGGLKNAYVQDANLCAHKGEVIALLGPNGAGKSTLLRTLSGLLPPLAGEVFLSGKNLSTMKDTEKAKKLSVSLTDKISIPAATVWEIAAMGRSPHTGFLGTLSDHDRVVVDESLRVVGALNLRARRYVSLSDGEKQKVMIARALAQEPEVLIMDEPLSHLDIKHKIEVALILNRLAKERGLSVILALHDIEIAVKFCHFVHLMKEGRVEQQGRPADILSGPVIDKLYGIQGVTYDSLLEAVKAALMKAPH